MFTLKIRNGPVYKRATIKTFNPILVTLLIIALDLDCTKGEGNLRISKKNKDINSLNSRKWKKVESHNRLTRLRRSLIKTML